MNSTDRLTRNRAFLDLLRDSKSVQAKAILKTASRDQILVIGEIFLNLLEKHFDLTDSFLRYVAKRKNIVRKLGDRKIKVSEKYKLVKKYSDFIRETLKQLWVQIHNVLASA